MNSGLILATVTLVWVLALCAMVLLRKNPNWIRLSFAGSFLLPAIHGLIPELLQHGSITSNLPTWQNARFLMVSLAPVNWVILSLCYARGNHLEELRRWKGLLLLLVSVPAVCALGFREILAPLSWEPTALHQGVLLLGWPATLICLTTVVASVLALTNLERTFRASVGTMRWRIKYAVIGLGGLFAVHLYSASQALLYSAIQPWLQSLETGALLLACLTLTVAFLRVESLSADLYPSKQAIYGSITIGLAGTYLFIVGVLAKIATALGGDGNLPLKSFLVLTGLAAAAALALSDRFRLLTKQFISRHFQRPVYDYRKIWQGFSENISSCQDPASLGRETVRLISATVEALSVSFWLVELRERRMTLAASTSISPTEQKEGLMDGEDFSTMVDQLTEGGSRPFDLDTGPASWLARLRKSNPTQFQLGGARVGFPLVCKRELVGLLVIGDRVGGVHLTLEDRDLIRCLADQAASSLMNLRLGAEIIRAKEMEAFQMMAAFFVHDLKNTASSLSLMLQNLPAQFENPEFRDDALKVVAKAVARIQSLIARLTTLREERNVELRDSDLNPVVEVGLVAAGPMPQLSVVKRLCESAPCRLDPEQIQKVVVNLLLNAREASSRGGTIEIETQKEEGWVWVSVRDTGCGMSAEFVRSSLFRPFQTTKRNGMGIGMFHCKTIVESHQGRIEVSSEPQKGTIFRVWLPS